MIVLRTTISACSIVGGEERRCVGRSLQNYSCQHLRRIILLSLLGMRRRKAAEMLGLEAFMQRYGRCGDGLPEVAQQADVQPST